MNVPLKALSWAVRFFWIIALAFAVTGVYSAMQLRMNFGEPFVTYAEETFTVTLPVIFNNRGYYDIADLNITTIIADSEKTQISRASSYLAKIPPQNGATIFHNVSFHSSEMIAHESFLFNDSSLLLYGLIHLDYANLIPFGVEANETIPWGAPLYNFTAGIPEYARYNVTHMRMSVPISFQNHSPYFSVTGTIRVEILNSLGQLLGTGTTSVDVASNAVYDDSVEALVSTLAATSTGQIRIFVDTEMFDYGPMVINYG
jgi:hypothetical protein